MKDFPLPAGRPLALAKQLDALGLELTEQAPAAVLAGWQPGTPLEAALAAAERRWAEIRGEMVAAQEELDWECYQLYGLIHPKDELLSRGTRPHLLPGQRAFEIVMARQMGEGKLETAWFKRHGSTPITEPPGDWPADYRALVERRIERMKKDRNVRLIEQPEYKRRWSSRPYDEQRQDALTAWLLQRLETYFDLDGWMNAAGTPTARLEVGLVKTSVIADVARKDSAFQEVARLHQGGRDDYDIEALVEALVRAESVPLLPVLRYSDSGREKRQLWEEVWRKQRLEDAIDALTRLPPGDPQRITEFEAANRKRDQVGKIDVPPPYEREDFARTEFWALRGELDVPKERWVSFPHSVGADRRLVVGWAGWNHLQLAQAVATHYLQLRDEEGGRDDPRLLPLLACLAELLPWLKQWHNELDEQFNTHLGDYYEGFVEAEARERGKTISDLRQWRPDPE